ncbi:class I SAM-dependent methyltransferase [Brachyspira intermedia]|uniref:class I SAM-dependent methyltransferase n=1 Tax=Brachyspira intermedia TaxID=84377 RepID=UPI003003EE02
MNIDELVNKRYEIIGKKYYDYLRQYHEKYDSQMTLLQMGFLMSLIEDNKPDNILELGVYTGVSDLAILKSGLKNNNNFNLYSIDLNVMNDEDFVAKAVKKEASDEEKKHYHLFLNKRAFDLEEIIPKDVKFDLVFIDAQHSHPGPLIDLLLIIPYLKENALVLLHDTIGYYIPYDFGASYVFETWNNKKYRIYDYDNNEFSGMGCIEIHYDKNELHNNLISISKIPFEANPWFSRRYDISYSNDNNIDLYKQKKYFLGIDLEDLKKLEIYLIKYYKNEKFVNDIMNVLLKNYHEYIEIVAYHVNHARASFFLFKDEQNIHLTIADVYKHIENIYSNLQNINFEKNQNIFNIINRLINSIAWWIPVRKWRDNFRNKILYGQEQSRAEQSRAEQSRAE